MSMPRSLDTWQTIVMAFLTWLAWVLTWDLVTINPSTPTGMLPSVLPWILTRETDVLAETSLPAPFSFSTSVPLPYHLSPSPPSATKEPPTLQQWNPSGPSPGTAAHQTTNTPPNQAQNASPQTGTTDPPPCLSPRSSPRLSASIKLQVLLPLVETQVHPTPLWA